MSSSQKGRTMGQSAYPAITTKGTKTLLSTTTLSGSSVVISNINQTYSSLFITLKGLTNTVGSGYNWLKPNGLSLIANASSIVIGAPDYTPGGFSDAFDLSDLRLNQRRQQFYTSANNYFEIEIKNYSSASLFKSYSGQSSYIVLDSTVCMSELKHGTFNMLPAITSLSLVNSTGTYNTGTIDVYGVA